MFALLFEFIGYLAVFLFGVRILGEGLESIARGKVRETVRKLTNSKIGAIMFGLMLTVILQFSAATVILTIGMVNSSAINLVQALGIIIGANIGTTLKIPFIIFNPYIIIPAFMVLGLSYYMFSRKKSHRDLAYVFLGIGLLFIGMHQMSLIMTGLKDSPFFTSMFSTISQNAFVGILVGIITTVLFQSSSATLAVLVSLAGTSGLTLAAAYPVILGANIGSVAPCLISAAGTGRDAKRTALMHLMFNVFGAVIMFVLSSFITGSVERLTPQNTAVRITLIHTLFNVITGLVILPLMNKVVDLSGVIIKERKTDVELTDSTVLDNRILNSPTFAEEQMVKQTQRMTDLARENIKASVEYFLTEDDTVVEKIKSNEEFINYLEVQITGFLVKLSTSKLSEKDIGKMAATHHMIADIEKIGDLAINIMELGDEKIQKNVIISEDAEEEIRAIYSYVIEAVNVAFDSYRNSDKNLASSIYDIEKKINEMEKEYRDSHIRRLHRGKCSAHSGILFVDLLSNLERVGDHTVNIAESVIKNIVI